LLFIMGTQCVLCKVVTEFVCV
jgi:hypothetical protein